MQNNLIFLCGPHGSGKTTLIDILTEKIPEAISPELKTRTPKFHTSPLHRLALKICQRSIENFEYLEIAKENPDKIVLGNRCIYDQFAYNLIYLLRNWISREDFGECSTISEISFIDELRDPYSIVLNPGFDAVKRHLEERWEEKGKKWREDDLEYTRLACQVYERFKGKENVFYIDKEINLGTMGEVEGISQWIEKIANRETVEV